MADGAVYLRRVSNPITQIPSEPAGNAKETAWFRQLLRCIRERTVKVGPGLRKSHNTDGTLIELIPVRQEVSVSESSAIQQYKITAIADDYIEAKTWDGTTLGDVAVQVAKPWRLRKTDWNGATVTYNFNGTIFTIQYTYLATPGFRTAVRPSTGVTENQAIIPLYSVNDIIYATEPDGGTLVTVNSTALTWLDLNVDARAWARY